MRGERRVQGQSHKRLGLACVDGGAGVKRAAGGCSLLLMVEVQAALRAFCSSCVFLLKNLKRARYTLSSNSVPKPRGCVISRRVSVVGTSSRFVLCSGYFLETVA